MSSRRLSYAALMVAAGLTGVYSEPIPNFELLTLVVFCSGILLGASEGALVGVVSELVFSVLNPYGAAPPLVTLSQVVGMAASGCLGGWAARAGLPRYPAGIRIASLALLAVLTTGFFDLVTNLASGVVYGQMRAVLIGGIPFSLIHIGSNVALFAILGAPLSGVFVRYRERLSSSP